MIHLYNKIHSTDAEAIDIRTELAALYLEYKANWRTIKSFSDRYFDGCEQAAGAALAAGSAYMTHLNNLTQQEVV